MQVKVYLHGHLKDKLKKDYILAEGFTARDVLSYVANRYKKELKAPLDVGRWTVKLKDHETKESLYVPLYTNELHLYPLFRMAKGAGLFKIVVGSVLIAVGAIFQQPNLVYAGIMMVVSGACDLLMPQPKLDTSTEYGSNSKYLGSSGNTTKVGTRIPFGYGLFKVAGHYISFNVSSTVLSVQSMKGDE